MKGFFFLFCWHFSVNIVVFYLFKKKVPPFFPHFKEVEAKFLFQCPKYMDEMGEQFLLIKQLCARNALTHWTVLQAG